jgi:hypothetical protein
VAFRFLRDDLDRRDSDMSVDQRLSARLEKHRAGEAVLSGWRSTWNRWGEKRETDGQRQDISVKESYDLHWEREPDSGDFVLLRRDSHFERDQLLRAEPYPLYRNHGWAEIGVDEGVSTRDAGKTGTAGRPSSWHLIEKECRRRYGKGERHTNKGIESPAGWADVLLPWLAEFHPNERLLTRKAATNNLSPLLLELKQGSPK